MRYYVLLLICFTIVCQSTAQINQKNKKVKQTDLIEVLVKAFHINVKQKPPDRKRISFSIVPVSTTSSGGSQILVSSINAAFTLGHEDSTNVSSVYLLPYTDFYENIGFGTKINLWTARNIWNFPAEFRLSSLTQYTYGIGSGTEKSDEFILKYNNLRAYFSANHRIINYIYAGLGLNYDRYYDVNSQDAPSSPNDFEKYGIGTSRTSFSTGLTFNALYDDRRNSINPDNGHYVSVIFRTNPTFFKNDYRWSSLYVDYRQYLSIDPSKRKIIALWAFYWGSYGEVPYFNLPGTQLEFGTRSGRGYSQARFRGKHMLYLESEYRFDISSNGLFGGVVFASIQSLTEPETNRFRYINPAVGAGARIKFNKESNTNLTLDFGFGKDSFNFYIGLGEFF